MATEPLAIVPGRSTNIPPNFFNVPASTSSVMLISNNPDRKMVVIFNDSTSKMYLNLGTPATTSQFKVKLAPQGYFEFTIPIFLGSINAVWDSTDGFAKVSEFV